MAHSLQILAFASVVMASIRPPLDNAHLPPAAAVPAVESKPDKSKSAGEIKTPIKDSEAEQGLEVAAKSFAGMGPKFGPSQLMGYGLGYGGLAGLGGFGYGGYGGGFGGYPGGFARGHYGSYGSFKEDPRYTNFGAHGHGGYGGGFGGDGPIRSHGAFVHAPGMYA